MEGEEATKRAIEHVTMAALDLIDGAEGAAVELLEGDELAYVAVAGSLLAHRGLRLKVEGSLSGEAIRTRETLWCRNTEVDDRVDRDACRRLGIRSMICVPVWQDDRPVGVVKVSASFIEAFNDRDVAAIAGLADEVATAITGHLDLANITGAMPPRRLST